MTSLPKNTDQSNPEEDETMAPVTAQQLYRWMMDLEKMRFALQDTKDPHLLADLKAARDGLANEAGDREEAPAGGSPEAGVWISKEMAGYLALLEEEEQEEREAGR